MAIRFLFFLVVGGVALLFLLPNSPPNNHPLHCFHPHSDCDDDDLNLTNTIVCVFPQIDVNPTDHYVSVHELTQWKLHHLQTKHFHRSKEEMTIYDKNLDGFVSFAEFEYGHPTPPLYTDGDSFGYDMRVLEEEHFNVSDTDGDGRLNLPEFHDFLHPADSNNPKLQQWLCREEVWERDTDRDGKLDKDGDGYLSAIELLPIIGKVHPSWRYYARKQAEYFVSQAQVGKFGRLNLNQMSKNADILYASIFRDESY